ncbi:nucleotidyltransferase domain-containing protein [Candidatus Micrarchaeota archaeon]|nr:nucleotidyltransferase domain-containing protein [Candidatus Micrarchaeota archaeon]
MQLENIYLKSLDKFGKGRFSPAQFAHLHGLSIQSSKVLIHRMGKNFQLFRAGRGEYVLLTAESFLKLQQLAKKNRVLHSMAIELFTLFPELKALVLYGSQVRGEADRFSDYDVLLILPEKLGETSGIRRRIEAKFRIKLHLTIYSENGYRNAVLSEPYIRFWLSEGLVLDEGGITRSPMPPIPKIAYEEWLSTAKTYTETASESGAEKRGRYYLTALEILGLIRSALKLSYDYGAVRKQLEGLLGSETLARIRGGRRLGRGEEKLLEKTCKSEIAAINALLRGIGYNEADIYWKSRLAVA